MGLLISSAALLLLMLFPGSASDAFAALQPDSVSPAWSKDLHAAVGSAPLGQVFGRKRERRGLPETSLWFLGDSTIVATFVTREGVNPSLSSRESSDPNQPLRLRAIFLDADTGKVRSVQAWPSEGTLARVVTASEGKFVIQSGTTLTLYSSDGKELKRLSLPPPPQNLNGWNAHPSPTGKSILFENSDWRTTSPKSWIWVNTDDLQIVRSWKEEQSGRIGISDSTIAMTACMFQEYHCDPNLRVKGLATEWKSIAPIERSGWVWAPQFVDNDTLFMPGTPWRLLKTDGKVVLTGAYPKGGGPISSADGQRFVIPFFKLVGRVEALDIGGHGELKAISVYDAPFHERAYQLEVKGTNIKSISDKSVAQLALSPDGFKLAILYEETVYVFQLPGAPGSRRGFRPGAPLIRGFFANEWEIIQYLTSLLAQDRKTVR